MVVVFFFVLFSMAKLDDPWSTCCYYWSSPIRMSQWSTIFRPVGGAEKPVSTLPTETYSEICSSSITNQTSAQRLLVCLRMLIRRCVYNNVKREEIQKMFPV